MTTYAQLLRAKYVGCYYRRKYTPPSGPFAMMDGPNTEVVWVHPNIINSDPPVYKTKVTGLDCIDANGMVAIPDGPGLGVEFDWDYIAQHSNGKWEITDKD